MKKYKVIYLTKMSTNANASNSGVVNSANVVVSSNPGNPTAVDVSAPSVNVPALSVAVLPAVLHKNVLNLQIRTFTTSVEMIDALMNATTLSNNNWSMIQPNVSQWLITAIKLGLSVPNATFDVVQRIVLPVRFNLVEIRTPGDWSPVTNTFTINISYIRIDEIKRRWHSLAESFVDEFRNSFAEYNGSHSDIVQLMSAMVLVSNRTIEFGVFVPN